MRILETIITKLIPTVELPIKTGKQCDVYSKMLQLMDVYDIERSLIGIELNEGESISFVDNHINIETKNICMSIHFYQVAGVLLTSFKNSKKFKIRNMSKVGRARKEFDEPSYNLQKQAVFVLQYDNKKVLENKYMVIRKLERKCADWSYKRGFYVTDKSREEAQKEWDKSQKDVRAIERLKACYLKGDFSTVKNFILTDIYTKLFL